MFYIDEQPRLGTRVPAAEACLMTSNGGEDLTLVLPKPSDDDELSGMATFLSAVLFRLKSDPAWVAEMVSYIETEIPEQS